MQAETKEQLAAELIRLAARDEHQRKIFTSRKEIIDTTLTLSYFRCEKGIRDARTGDFDASELRLEMHA